MSCPALNEFVSGSSATASQQSKTICVTRGAAAAATTNPSYMTADQLGQIQALAYGSQSPTIAAASGSLDANESVHYVDATEYWKSSRCHYDSS
jgi:hypothetical protein